MNRLITIFLFGYLQPQPGILKVGFDIDDTVLYSEPAFQHYKKEYGLPIDYGWINANDNQFSILITPTVEQFIFLKPMDTKSIISLLVPGRMETVLLNI